MLPCLVRAWSPYRGPTDVRISSHAYTIAHRIVKLVCGWCHLYSYPQSNLLYVQIPTVKWMTINELLIGDNVILMGS